MSENCSHNCENCSEIRVFGESHVEDIARKHNIATVAKLPIGPKLAAACDRGMIENFEGDWLNKLFANLTDKN